MRCSSCNTELNQNANFCHHCGQPCQPVAVGQTIQLAREKVGTLRSGTCPICLSSEVFTQSGGIYDHYGLKFSDTSNPEAPLNTYVCLQCGFVELFLNERAPAAMIERTWKKVTKSDF